MQRFWRRAVVSTLVMLLALITAAALGVWQYSVAHRDDLISQVKAAAPVGIESVTAPGKYLAERRYGQNVRVAGVLDCTKQFIVRDEQRRNDWLVCPLQLRSGLQVAIVLGATTGRVSTAVSTLEMVGRIQPAQTTASTAAIYPKPAPRIVDLISSADLAARWQSDVLDGYVVANSKLAKQLGLLPISDAELLWPPAGIELRNLFYAWQWWIFAAFSVFLWLRYIRDEWQAAVRLNS